MLDLKGTGLEILPPQISLLKSLEELDISNNDISFFPPELQLLPLKKLDISGNRHLQSRIPEWIGTKPHLTLTAYKIGLNHIPNGVSGKQIICEVDLKRRERQLRFCQQQFGK